MEEVDCEDEQAEDAEDNERCKAEIQVKVN